MFPKHIFRAYDIRGKYPEELSLELMESIGKTVGTMLTEKGLKSIVVVGDTRWSSEEAASALKKGLLQTEIEVFDAGEASFGSALYCAVHYKKDATAYVTPSHLPADYSGLKLFYGDGVPFTGEEMIQVGKRTEEEDWRIGQGTDGGALDAKAPYLEFVSSRFDCSGVKVVIDCGGGATVTSHPEVFRAVGLEVTEVFCEKDPQLKVRDPKPKEDNVGELISKVKETGADLGVAFDADGDRGVLVDERGEVLTPDEPPGIIAKRQLAKEKGVIIVNVECSMMAEDYLAPMGADVKRIPVGHTYMVEEGKRHNALFGYEDSNHMVMPRIVYFDDPVFVVLTLAEIIKAEGKKLSELASEVPAYSRTRVVVSPGDDKKFGVVKKLQEKLSAEYENTNTIDGIRVDFDDAWILIRASNTEPIVRLTVEAKTEERMNELAQKFGKVLKEAGE